jgi:ankyrin repeat protein
MAADFFMSKRNDILKAGLLLLALSLVLSATPAQEIHDAAQKGEVRRVRQLLEKKPELINEKDSGWGRTPLHWAARGVHFEVLKLLVDKGADVKAKDNSDITALHSVAIRGHREAANLLVSKGAELNAVDSFGHTPLSYAITGGHKELAEFLISKGATVPIRGEAGRRLLHASASQGNKALVDWTADKGVDLTTENGNGGTILHSACEGGLTDFAEKLIGRGFAVNVPDRYGLTPLHYAAANGHKAVVEILLNHKADSEARTLTGERPIHLALESDQKETADFLSARGADPGPPAFPRLKGDYLGQKRPGENAELFALGIVSSKDWEHSSPDFSPDGTEVYWTSISGRMRILRMKLEKGKWSAPAPAPFTGFDDCYPRFSDDGKRLYYVSYRPLIADRKNPGFGINLWFVKRTKSGWAEPRPVGPPFDTGNIFGFSMTREGTVYYAEGGGISFDIYRSKFAGRGYSGPERLGEAVNSDYVEDEPFIAPDESYLIFKSMRPGGFGGADLYISFRREDGSWTDAKSLGPLINTEHAERFPSVGRDGKYFFFGSDRNGNPGDIYWVSAGFIEKLRPQSSKQKN